APSPTRPGSSPILPNLATAGLAGVQVPVLGVPVVRVSVVPVPTGCVPMVCVPRGSSGGVALASLPLGFGGAIDRGDNVRAFEMIDVRSIALLDFPESQRYRLVNLGIDLVAAHIDGTAAGVHGPRANLVLRQRQEIGPGLGPLLSARLVVVCGGPVVVERGS